MFFMAYVISLLGSRYPIVVSLLLASFAAFQFRTVRSFAAMFGAVFLLCALNLGVAGVQNLLLGGSLHTARPILRFQEDSGSRVEKNMLAIRMIGGSAKNFFIGPSAHETEAATTASGVKFSDNSYLMLMLGAGAPAALLLFVMWAWYLRRFAISPLTIFCLMYSAGVLLITNALLWESWVCSILFTLAIVARYAGGMRTKEGHT
jgi:hypothetical protein